MWCRRNSAAATGTGWPPTCWSSPPTPTARACTTPAGRRVDLPGYRVDAVTDAAIRYVDARAREAAPFFLFVSFIEPHFQNSRDDYPAPTGYEEAYTGAWLPPDLAALGGSTHQHLAGYYGMVRRLDEALGRLQDALRSLDLLQSTVLLYTTDHGCHFKTRNAEYKRSCHESSIRLPTAVSGPGFDGGGRVPQLTSLIDLPPTLLDAAGITPPGGDARTLGAAAAHRSGGARRVARRRVRADQRVTGGPRRAHRALEVRRARAGSVRQGAVGRPLPGTVPVRSARRPLRACTTWRAAGRTPRWQTACGSGCCAICAPSRGPRPPSSPPDRGTRAVSG